MSKNDAKINKLCVENQITFINPHVENHLKINEFVKKKSFESNQITKMIHIIKMKNK